MQETQVQSLGQEDPLEKGMATHSSILPWEFHGQRNLMGYGPWGRKESDTTEQLALLKYSFIYLAVPGPSCSIWDLVPWPGIKPGTPALETWSPSC